MADIDVVPKRRSMSWVWWVVAIVVLAVILWWAFGNRAATAASQSTVPRQTAIASVLDLVDRIGLPTT